MKKRIIISAVFVTVFFASIITRLGYIALSGSFAVGETYNSYTLLIDSKSPNLYYHNYKRLTNNTYERYALLKPNAKTLAELPKLFNNTEEIINELKKGKPLLEKTDIESSEYIPIINVSSSDYNCKQLISRECSGLLKYLPVSIGEKRMRFHVDALGRMLTGDEGTVIDDNYVSSEGLLLTLDSEIQNIAYNACKSVKSGCVIIMDVNSSSIVACVTKPDESYLNKPFLLYSVGSVFKLIIAACAIENNISIDYTCNGKIKIRDTEYTCQNNKEHKSQNLEQALVNSCNCYFINLAEILGAKRILETAQKFGFGNDIKIYKDWIFKGSSLPSAEDMNNDGELPLVGFGQGKLMSTPVQFCNALCTIANGGYYNSIKLVLAEIDKYGEQSLIKYKNKNRVISKNSAKLLLKYMRSVVKNGSGRNADYKNESAGKTATAQTGQIKNGRELLNTWFAGVYPYTGPKYAIVVMVEDGISGAESCCPIFRTIVEKLGAM